MAQLKDTKIFGTTELGDGGTTNYASFAADGELTLNGTARVSKTEWISVGAFKAPGTKPAENIDYGIAGGWEFSDATDDTIVATKRLPVDMDKTVAPSFKIGWGSAETTGDVVWQLEYLYVSAGESLAAAAQDTNTTTTTVSGTANGLNVTTIEMDAAGASDQLLKVRIKRLGADAADTLSGTAILVGCGFNYTSDKLGVGL